jgi:hypothetical protein
MTRKQYLLGTTMPHAMHPTQMRELQKQLAVVLLAWDGVAKAMKDARAKVNG